MRETMNQLVEAWKGIADVESEASPPLPTEPQSSPKGIRLQDYLLVVHRKNLDTWLAKKKKSSFSSDM